MSLTTEPATGMALGKDLSTLGSYSVSGETITGSVNKITDWTEFNSNTSEQTGYYVALEVDDWEGNSFRIDRTTGKGKAVAFNGDGIAILFLGADQNAVNTAQSFVVITPEGEVSYTFDVTLAN